MKCKVFNKKCRKKNPEINIEICQKTFLEVNENDNTTQHELWDNLKAILTGNFIVLIGYIKTSERMQIHGLW